jgi:hypothetical protein
VETGDNRKLTPPVDWLPAIAPIYKATHNKIHAHAFVDTTLTTLKHTAAIQSRFQILDLLQATPHIWGSVSRDFGADSVSSGTFVHTAGCLSTVFRELSTKRGKSDVPILFAKP